MRTTPRTRVWFGSEREREHSVVVHVGISVRTCINTVVVSAGRWVGDTAIVNVVIELFYKGISR